MGVDNVVNISGVNDNPYDALVLSAVTALLPGQTISPPVYTQKRLRATDKATQVSASASFSWRPSTRLGGYNQPTCFRLSQLGGPGATGSSATRCFRVSVLRCKYLAQPGDTLRSVAAAFQVDWLALWGLNVGLRTMDVRAGQELVVGRLYAVQEGDSLATVAREMATGVDVLRRLNYDFADQAADTRLAGVDVMTGLGTALCVQPNTCAPD